ncbi:tyrosine--tRNA ligase [Candidatus Woesearchaeota archaeon]|nr:tyrosine--tRNA ligase [Candidatus Woesearchaeota archaeon]
MDNDEKYSLITRGAQEVLTSEDLRSFIADGTPLRHYIGFEISGKVHLGTGLMTGMKISDMQKAGVKCSCYLATYHAWINNKLGGDLEKIRAYTGYFKEALRKSIDVMGGDSDSVRFVSGDELYHNNDEYWRIVIDVAKHMTLNRSLRAITILGRKEGEAVSTAQLLYPAMQVADIFVQDINIAHAGMDQRKAHVVAREVAEKLVTRPLRDISGKIVKPVALHHSLLMGLAKPPSNVDGRSKEDILSEIKMSKSIPGSAVFVTDTPDEIRDKIKNAYCPAKIVDLNPIINWVEHVVFSSPDSVLNVKRSQKFGGDKTYESFDNVVKDFSSGSLHPVDLKFSVGEFIIDILEPVRKSFSRGNLAVLHKELDSIVGR